MRVDIEATPYKGRRSFLEVLWVFLRLGVTSFGCENASNHDPTAKGIQPIEFV